MYDLGAEHDLRALRLTTYKFGVPPPAPPATPPPPFPSICIGSVGTADCYDNLVLRANNGICAL